ISTGRLAHKFGVEIGDAEAVYDRARKLPNLLLEGVGCHIGSQLFQMEQLQALEKLLDLAALLRGKGFDIRHVDVGGGLGVAYKHGDAPPAIADYVTKLRDRLKDQNLHVLIEPGRSIVGGAGVLLTRVLYRKKTGDKEFVIVDAAMNDLIRPVLYSAHHDIVPVRQDGARPSIKADVVGPVCETGDFLARDREMPEALPGDLLAVCTAGAYGFVQSSNYNARPRPAEVLVENGTWRIVRRRESFEDMVRGEE
ncbi:MAG: diaminopimelate decarboxylase, partial [Terriglobia bacterium]